MLFGLLILLSIAVAAACLATSFATPAGLHILARFAVLFGLLILLSIAVAAACYWMKWGLSATFLVACLWALNAVVMFLGMGKRPSRGGCLSQCV